MNSIGEIVCFSRRHSNAKQWSMGKKRFNENPKEVRWENWILFSSIVSFFFWKIEKGIQWFMENGLIQNTPEHTAAFLYNETGLSKRAIGDYLGEK